MSCAWRLGAGVSRVVAQLLFFRAAASGAPSFHRVPGAPGHFPRTPGRASGSSYALQRTPVYAPSLVHGLAQGKLIRSVDWGTILALFVRAKLALLDIACPALAKVCAKGPCRYFGLPGPGKRVCEGASHAGTSDCPALAKVFAKEPRRYFRRVLCGDCAS